MRVLIVDTCYDAFLDAHYGRQPGLEDQPYELQWRALMDTFFGTADSYSHFLAPLGHEAHEVVVNCEPLQQAWAREHAPGLAGEDLLLRQVDAHAPDVVYVQNLDVLADSTLAELRRRRLLIAGQIAIEAPPDERLRAFDLLVTSFPHFVERFRRAGLDAEYLPLCFDPRIVDALGPAAGPPAHDAIFVGALNGLRHRRGNAALARAARKLPLEFWGYDTRGWPPWSPIRRRYHGEAWGLEMFRLLRDSRIVLNRHIGAAEQNANNMRLYEVTGVGSLLLTDAKENVAELFEPGREVVTYAGADELVERARHYLEHEDERLAVAAAGQARTLRDHGYPRRMAQLAELLERRLA